MGFFMSVGPADVLHHHLRVKKAFLLEHVGFIFIVLLQQQLNFKMSFLLQSLISARFHCWLMMQRHGNGAFNTALAYILQLQTQLWKSHHQVLINLFTSGVSGLFIHEK